MRRSGTVRTVVSMIHSTRATTALGLAAASLLFLSACGGADDATSAPASDEPTAETSAEGGEPGAPDLSDIPDVVAEVNGEEVTKDEFVLIYEAQLEQALAAVEQGGEQPDEAALKEQTANNLVDAELLSQEADSRGIEVSDEDVDAELTSLAEANQLGTAEDFIAALEKEGATEAQVREQIELQVMVEQLVADEVGGVEPSEEELRAIYDAAKEQQAQSGEQAQPLPPFAEVRDQIAEQAQTDQVGTVAQELVTELRKDADITINL